MSSSIFSSNTSERRWVDQMNDHFVIYVDSPPSIFQVPENVRDTNPQAYSPHQIGIGAYHHFRPNLDATRSRKLEAVNEFFMQEQREKENFKSLIVDRVKALESDIRSCYSKYLDLDGDTLAWIMAIDGVYLLHLLSTYSGEKTINVDERNLAQDIFMLENQLPCFVLKEIKEALQLPGDEDEGDEFKEDEFVDEVLPDEDEEDEVKEDEFVDEVLPDEDEEDEVKEDEFVDELKPVSIMDQFKYTEDIEIGQENMDLSSQILSFCKSHTPLKLTNSCLPLVTWTNSSPHHLLHIMYNLVKSELQPEKLTMQLATAVPCAGELAVTGFKQAAQVAGDLTGLKPLQLLANLPLQEFLDLFKRDNQTTDTSSVEEIQIPSASQLHRVSKIDFKLTQNSGEVQYDKSKHTLYLPEITLNTDSEVVLRNLVAYEVSCESKNVVSGYVDFMCGIIDTAKDVDLLRERKIIVSDLPSEEIAKMFNRIIKSRRMEPDLDDINQKLNVDYNNTFRVKAGRFMKDHFVPSETTVKLALGILLVLVLILQAFCQVYGCSARWFPKN